MIAEPVDPAPACTAQKGRATASGRCWRAAFDGSDSERPAGWICDACELQEHDAYQFSTETARTGRSQARSSTYLLLIREAHFRKEWGDAVRLRLPRHTWMSHPG